MPTKVSYVNATATLYNDEDVAQLQTDFFTEGVADTTGSNTDCQVSEKSGTPDMSVDIAVGRVYIDISWDSRSFKTRFSNLAIANVAVEANSSGSDRVDAVVAEIDNTATPDASGSNVGSFSVVKNTTGTPTAAMSDGDINTALGHSNWYRLADITVPNGTADIENGDITDTRELVGFKNTFSVYELVEQSADPDYVANKGKLYTKDVAGETELHYIDASGNITQITSGGSLNVVAANDKVAVSNNDTTPDYLENKIVGSGLAGVSTLNDGGDEDIQIDVPIHSQAEAEAGLLNTKAMTALRTAQAIDALTNTEIFTAGENLSEGDAFRWGLGNFVIDQSAVATGDNTSAQGVNWKGMTFTTGSGVTKLDRVTLKLYKTGNPGTATMSIYAESGGFPTGSPLASKSFDGNALTTSGTGQDLDIDLDSTLTIVGSTKYAIVISAPSGDASNTVKWIGSPSSVYPNGNAINSFDSGGSWANDGTADRWFETYSMGEDPAKVYKTDASDSNKILVLGYACAAALADALFCAKVSSSAVINLNGTAAKAETLYLSDTPGQVQNSAGSNSVKVGRYIDDSEDKMIIYLSI